MYVKDGKPKYCYICSGSDRYKVESDRGGTVGQASGADKVKYDGGGLGKGGTWGSTLTGSNVGEGRVDAHANNIFGRRTCDVGNQHRRVLT